MDFQPALGPQLANALCTLCRFHPMIKHFGLDFQLIIELNLAFLDQLTSILVRLDLKEWFRTKKN